MFNQKQNSLPAAAVAAAVSGAGAVSAPDGWISMKVKSTLMNSTTVDASDIVVNTNDGHVKLAGRMGSGQARVLAIELVRDVRGVRSVDTSSLTM